MAVTSLPSSRASRRLRARPLLLLLTALLFPELAAVPASAAPSPAGTTVEVTSCRPAPASVGAIAFRWLPAGLGARWDGSPHSYDDVDFVAAVWESGSDQTGRSTDLHITVMSGARLASAQALHDWFIEYQQRPADEVDYRRTTVRGAPGWITHDQIFWLVRPGLAASVTIDVPRWSAGDLRRLVTSSTITG